LAFSPLTPSLSPLKGEGARRTPVTSRKLIAASLRRRFWRIYDLAHPREF